MKIDVKFILKSVLPGSEKKKKQKAIRSFRSLGGYSAPCQSYQRKRTPTSADLRHGPTSFEVIIHFI